MGYMNRLVTLVFTLITIINYGQQSDTLDYSENLVLNYSFENHGTLPCERVNIGNYSMFTIDHWAWASYASVDVFSTKVDENCFSYTDNFQKIFQFNTMGSILPRTGDVILGFYGVGLNKGHEYHEYLITKLKHPLLPKYEYYVEFWVCRSAGSHFASNNIGACFTRKPVFYKNTKSIYAKPEVNYQDVIVSRNKWTKISGYFIPNDTLCYMLIGNFFSDEKSQIISMYNKKPYRGPDADSYYLLDDVFVLPAGEKADYSKNIIKKSEFETAEVNEAVILKNVFFNHDKSEILPKSYPELNKLVNFLSYNPSVTLEISGHTDNTGTEKYNISLSLSRAQSVATYLIEKGIMDTRITYKGYGNSKPIAENNTEKGRMKNRRVEFSIIKK